MGKHGARVAGRGFAGRSRPGYRVGCVFTCRDGRPVEETAPGMGEPSAVQGQGGVASRPVAPEIRVTSQSRNLPGFSSENPASWEVHQAQAQRAPGPLAEPHFPAGPGTAVLKEANSSAHTRTSPRSHGDTRVGRGCSGAGPTPTRGDFPGRLKPQGSRRPFPKSDRVSPWAGESCWGHARASLRAPRGPHAAESC